MVAAAEGELGEGVALRARQLGLEFDCAGSQHIGRRGDNDGARCQLTLLGLHADAAAPVDALDGPGLGDRKAGGKLGQQRAVALPGGRIDLAFVDDTGRRSTVATGALVRGLVARRPDGTEPPAAPVAK